MPPMLFWWIVACWFIEWGTEFNGFGAGWRIGLLGLVGVLFTAIIGPAGYSPPAGESWVEIYLCVGAGGVRC